MKRAVSILAAMLVLFASDAECKGGKDKSEKVLSKSEHSSSKPEKAPKPGPPGPATAGFDGFKNARGKNIFDPGRRGLKLESSPGGPPPPGSSPRGRSLTLTGTMVTEGKSLAFFGGPAAEGNRVVPVGATVANLRILSITSAQVALEHDGKTLVLDVGRQLSLGEGGAPEAGPIIETAVPPRPEVTAPTIPASDKADLIRRMMERRVKEAGQ